MTVDKIRKAALIKFTEKGYEGASLSDIAQEVGIKKQSIYSHFKNKDALFLDVMNQVIKEEIEFVHTFFTQQNYNIQSYLKKFVLEFKKKVY